MSEAKGMSGNTVEDIREIARMWDESAKFCDTHGEADLAERDRRLASAMRVAAQVLESAA